MMTSLPDQHPIAVRPWDRFTRGERNGGLGRGNGRKEREKEKKVEGPGCSPLRHAPEQDEMMHWPKESGRKRGEREVVLAVCLCLALGMEKKKNENDRQREGRWRTDASADGATPVDSTLPNKNNRYETHRNNRYQTHRNTAISDHIAYGWGHL
jgi:hypothetical protein